MEAPCIAALTGPLDCELDIEKGRENKGLWFLTKQAWLGTKWTNKDSSWFFFSFFYPFSP